MNLSGNYIVERKRRKYGVRGKGLSCYTPHNTQRDLTRNTHVEGLYLATSWPGARGDYGKTFGASELKSFECTCITVYIR